MTPALVTLATGLLLIMTSGCIGLHEILLSPRLANYPDARRRVRAAMFVVAVAFLYRGGEILYGLTRPDPAFVTFGGAIGTAALFVASALHLEQVLRQWLPARLQRRVQQLIDIASCRRRRELAAARRRALANVAGGAKAPSPDVVAPALAELTLQGVPAFGPCEPPDLDVLTR